MTALWVVGSVMAFLAVVLLAEWVTGAYRRKR